MQSGDVAIKSALIGKVTGVIAGIPAASQWTYWKRTGEIEASQMRVAAVFCYEPESLEEIDRFQEVAHTGSYALVICKLPGDSAAELESARQTMEAEIRQIRADIFADRTLGGTVDRTIAIGTEINFTNDWEMLIGALVVTVVERL